MRTFRILSSKSVLLKHSKYYIYSAKYNSLLCNRTLEWTHLPILQFSCDFELVKQCAPFSTPPWPLLTTALFSIFEISHFGFHRSEIMWWLSSWAWLTSFNSFLPSSSKILLMMEIPLFLIVQEYSMCIYSAFALFIHLYGQIWSVACYIWDIYGHTHTCICSIDMHIFEELLKPLFIPILFFC